MRTGTKRFLALLLGASALTAAAYPMQAQDPLVAARKHYSLAQEYLRQYDRDQALRELKSAIQLVPDFVEAHNDYITNSRSKPPEIVAEYEGYLKQHPQSATFHYLLGRAYYKAGLGKDGAAEYQKALELSSGYSWALVEQGNEVLKAGDSAKAGEYFEKARAQAGESTVLHMALANRLNSVQQYESAIAESQRALQLDPTCFDACLAQWKAKLGLTSASDTTQTEVIQDIKSLAAKNPKNPKALHAAMRGYGIFFEDKEVARIRKTILAMDPNFFAGGARYMVTTVSGEPLEFSGPFIDHFMDARALGNPKAQLAAYKRIEGETNDQNFKLYGLYMDEARTYLKLGDLANAEKLYDLLEKAGLNSSNASMAALQTRMAEAYIDRKIKLDLAQNYLADAVAASRKSIAQAEAARGSASAYQKQGLSQLLYTRGRLYMAQGKPGEAIFPLEESIKLAERESTALDLGLAYATLNRTEESIKMLTAACAFEGARQKEARTALERIYGDRGKARPLAAMLNEAVARRKAIAAEEAKRSGQTSALVGKAAPPFTLTSVAGQKVNLSELQGKVILLNFWATW
jgi:tetratricopeptide (TPR) repeat protein